MNTLRGAWRWIAGAGAVAAGIVAAAVVFKWQILMVVILLFIVAITIAIVLLVRQLQRAQAADQIERTITSQADADIERSTVGQLAETQRLKADLLAAIDQLKSSGKHGGGDALARLPWYMLIGPAGAGKSELVKRSGLEFPLREAGGDPRSVRGVGGTRSFSWWLSNEAVMLDMAGKTLATAAFDDSGDWVAFLETLGRQRPGHPINGVLVVVAIDQIADQPEARIDSIARAARERMEELVQHLGVVFPVYVVFSRADQVAGFAEFFDDLNPTERREAWGATLSRERALSRPADELFDEEFGVLLGSLSERRLPRMAAMADTAGRARAFAFPLQLERVRGSMRRFLRTLFDAPEGVESPVWRGFYLTASAQTGEPTDRVLQPAVRTLGLRVRSPERPATVRGGSWFVRDLLTDVVFPDASLAATSSGARGRLARGQRFMIGAYALAFVILFATFAGFSCSNHGIVNQVKMSATEVGRQVTNGTALVDNLERLDKLSAAADRLDRIERSVPFTRRIGGWAGGVERDPAVRLWMQRTAEYVLKSAEMEMRDNLRARVDGAPGTFLDDYYRFRAWRLLCDPRQIHVEDAPILTREVAAALADRLSMGGANEAGRARYPELVRRQMEFLARNPNDLAAVVRNHIPEADAVLAAGMAEIVRSTWQSEAFYRELVASTDTLRPLGLEALAGAGTIMAAQATVPGAFTREGWSDVVKPGVAWYGRMLARDQLMIDAFHAQPPALERDLLDLYAADVTRHWVAFLDGVSIAPQSMVSGAADLLAKLATGDSPLFKLLRGVQEQVQGITAAGTPVENVQRDFMPLTDFFAQPATRGQRAKDFVAGLSKLIPGQGNRPTVANQSYDAEYLNKLAKAQADVEKLGRGASLADLQALLSPPPDQTNGVFELVQFADGVGATYQEAPVAHALARLLREPATVAGQTVLRRGLGPLAAKDWENNFLSRFQTSLAGLYPLAESGRDATEADFTAFFAPTIGHFWVFYNKHLAPFLNEDGSPKTQGELPVSPEMVEFLRRAYAIRQALYAAGPSPSASFTVSTTPPQHDQGTLLVRWVAFDCGGKPVTYTMGPPQEQSVIWPGPEHNGTAALRVQAAPPENPKKKRKKNDPTSITVEQINGPGIWGLFRLLDRAALATSGSTTEATWTLRAANGQTIMTTWEFKATTGENPFAKGFLRLQPPSTP